MINNDEFERRSKIVIGNLLLRACPLSKTVITAFDPLATRKVNCATLNTGRYKLESLEACGVFLNIVLADGEQNKIYTKATLVSRIVAAFFALLPAACSACLDYYCIDFEPEEKPFFCCNRCFQGSHSCDKMKPLCDAIAELELPSGLVWLCKECLDSINPVVPRKSKSRHNSITKPDPVKSRLSLESTTPGSSDQSTVETPKTGTDAFAHDLRRRLSEQIEIDLTKEEDEDDEKLDTSQVCKKYKVGKCPHGIRGNKLVDGSKCPNSHPPRCNKYTRFGTGKKGCKKGKDCQYFHPILCKFSVNDQRCSNDLCTFPHLVGTKRGKVSQSKTDHNRQRSRSTSKVQISGKPEQKKEPTVSRSKSSDDQGQNGLGQNHFLELKRMVLEMGSNFNEELAKIKRVLHHPMYPPMAMSSPPIPQGHSMTYPFLPPACYTPRLSS
jgi:hypothetical protein